MLCLVILAGVRIGVDVCIGTCDFFGVSVLTEVGFWFRALFIPLPCPSESEASLFVSDCEEEEEEEAEEEDEAEDEDDPVVELWLVSDRLA